MDEGYEVYCGLDVGKSEHHVAALNAAGERVFDKPLPQDEARLRELDQACAGVAGARAVPDWAGENIDDH